MDVLVVLGTTSAWVYGVVLIFMGHMRMDDMSSHEEYNYELAMEIQMHTHNFEISSTLITVILLGKLLEALSKKQTVDKLTQLASLKVIKAFAVKSTDLGEEAVETDVELICVGDYIKVLNGQSIPVDGIVVAGTGFCNESMLTGEEKPVAKLIGNKVFGGSVLTKGAIILRVTKLSENAVINQLIKLVENA
jgi:Cu+-exporting ATPase